MHPAIRWTAPEGDHPARLASQRSMSAVARGAKDEWLALFAPDAIVEDPVGPSFLDPEGVGRRGRDEIGAFWDGTVATMTAFRFTIADSFANGSTCANVATIESTLPDGSTMTVDAVLVYTVDDDGLITSLRAYWEPDRALATIT
jgi:ketosteroid isomerase-like protein